MEYNWDYPSVTVLALTLNQQPSLFEVALTLPRAVFIILYYSSQSKVTNFSNIIVTNQNIPGSQVSMDKLLAFQVLHSTSNLQPTQHNALSTVTVQTLYISPWAAWFPLVLLGRVTGLLARPIYL
jgi:hypothetical protein